MRQARRIPYLLIEDVEDVGRSGEVIPVKPGFARNYLIPTKKAVMADEHTLRMQAKLQEKRAAQAAVDKKEAEELAAKLEGIALEIDVKVDPEGHLYGSVGQMDIVHLFEKQGVKLERRNIVLPHPIKQLGIQKLTLRLKEDVTCSFTLDIKSETPLPQQS
jgi:large subunit ribosomal protein L9